jgi:hypothetical protein
MGNNGNVRTADKHHIIHFELICPTVVRAAEQGKVEISKVARIVKT